MVLEFLWAFGETFDLKNEFPDGVSLGENLQRLLNSQPLPQCHSEKVAVTASLHFSGLIINVNQ